MSKWNTLVLYRRTGNKTGMLCLFGSQHMSAQAALEEFNAKDWDYVEPVGVMSTHKVNFLNDGFPFDAVKLVTEWKVDDYKAVYWNE